MTGQPTTQDSWDAARARRESIAATTGQPVKRQRIHPHQIGTTGKAILGEDQDYRQVTTLQASSMADVLGAPPTNADPYVRSVALIVDRTDLLILERVLDGQGDEDDLEALEAIRAALAGRPTTLR